MPRKCVSLGGVGLLMIPSPLLPQATARLVS